MRVKKALNITLKDSFDAFLIFWLLKGIALRLKTLAITTQATLKMLSQALNKSRSKYKIPANAIKSALGQAGDPNNILGATLTFLGETTPY
ncbi:hypothetical protein [Corallincola spongiicola]|uniref:Uncharacterized protein n=1 Tax=Corallincola spongiicola TaxID=2520508 RepID=A0ABY1WUI2_9GAMM|nr:hypothetical protein [Corallincola spongiicola]TAA48410.1 hypothetical protein EXY25_04085 [Corallincola spongiicola]